MISVLDLFDFFWGEGVLYGFVEGCVVYLFDVELELEGGGGGGVDDFGDVDDFVFLGFEEEFDFGFVDGFRLGLGEDEGGGDGGVDD